MRGSIFSSFSALFVFVSQFSSVEAGDLTPEDFYESSCKIGVWEKDRKKEFELGERLLTYTLVETDKIPGALYAVNVERAASGKGSISLSKNDKVSVSIETSMLLKVEDVENAIKMKVKLASTQKAPAKVSISLPVLLKNGTAEFQKFEGPLKEISNDSGERALTSAIKFDGKERVLIISAECFES